MICSVLKKRKRDQNGNVVESRSYYLRYRFDPMPVEKWKSLGTTDKQVAEKKAHDFYRIKQQEAAGLIPTESYREAGKERLLTHLEDLSLFNGKKGVVQALGFLTGLSNSWKFLVFIS